ncbi:MAG: lmo0937 family membrane protein [Smithella sp.]
MDKFYLRKESNMPSAILMILLILWYLGLLTGYTMGGGIHILLVIAITVLVAHLIQEKKYYNDLNRCRRR